MGRAYSVRKASIMKTGAAKAKLYSMYSKEIYEAAKKSSDPESNLILKRILEKARKEQVPNEIINKALDKVKSGKLETYEKLRYEGFGPGNSTLIIDVLTDNSNRSISHIRTAFSKVHCKLGSLCSVSYLYTDYCVLSFKGLSEDETIEALLNAEVNAEIEVEDNSMVLYGEPQDLYKIKNAILDYKENIVFEIDELTTLANEEIDLNEDDKKVLEKLLELLDDIDDVKSIYHNVNLQ